MVVVHRTVKRYDGDVFRSTSSENLNNLVNCSCRFLKNDGTCFKSVALGCHGTHQGLFSPLLEVFTKKYLTAF